ncbi:MAG: sigma-70 family RNA polymerase sigma factor [Clostridia bacterium]|nr:sigma-70 family RNA polymerase sigma factor [Clostridia bacterium]
MDKQREDFINANTGLVHACVKRFKNKGIEYDDLFQVGMIGLIKAYDRFNKSLGYKFSTYAVPIILGEIKHIFRENSTVKISRSLKDLALKINKHTNEFVMKNSRSPTISELSKSLDVEKEKVVQALEASQPTVSLSVGYSEDTEMIPFEIAVDEDYDEIADKIALKQAILKLSDEDRAIILLRFFKNKTQTQTAHILKTTQVQISRKERKILMELRRILG